MTKQKIVPLLLLASFHISRAIPLPQFGLQRTSVFQLPNGDILENCNPLNRISVQDGRILHCNGKIGDEYVIIKWDDDESNRRLESISWKNGDKSKLRRLPHHQVLGKVRQQLNDVMKKMSQQQDVSTKTELTDRSESTSTSVTNITTAPEYIVEPMRKSRLSMKHFPSSSKSNGKLPGGRPTVVSLPELLTTLTTSASTPISPTGATSSPAPELYPVKSHIKTPTQDLLWSLRSPKYKRLINQGTDDDYPHVSDCILSKVTADVSYLDCVDDDTGRIVTIVRNKGRKSLKNGNIWTELTEKEESIPERLRAADIPDEDDEDPINDELYLQIQSYVEKNVMK